MTSGFLATWGPLILSLVTVLAGGGFLKVIFDRTLTRAMADGTKATSRKTRVEGEVAQSADQRAWVVEARDEARAARADAQAARADADASRRSAWAAQDSAAAARTENLSIRERVDDLEDLIRSCARTGCPIQPLLPAALPKEDPMPPTTPTG